MGIKKETKVYWNLATIMQSPDSGVRNEHNVPTIDEYYSINNVLM